MDAPLGSFEFEESDELERLRRRAYGPDADIAEDATAQARLSELEAAQPREMTPVVDAAASVPTPGPERGPVREPVEGSVTEESPAERPVADPGPIDAAPAAPWWRRHRIAILGGAIAAIALHAAALAWMSQLLADGSTPIPADTSTAKMLPVPGNQTRPIVASAPDYVLALESVGVEADAPNDRHGTLALLGVSPDELRRYEDFRGLNVWSGESRYGVACLFVAVPFQGIREGFGAEGCSPAGLDTVAELEIPAGSGLSFPPGFDTMPAGSLTRFLLRDDHVNVYVYVRTPDKIPSQG